MALTNRWIQKTAQGGTYASGVQLVTTGVQAYGFCGNSWVTGNVGRITIGSFYQEFPLPLVNEAGYRVNIPISTGPRAAGTAWSITLGTGANTYASISGTLPQAIDGTSYVRVYINNGVWNDYIDDWGEWADVPYCEFSWGTYMGTNPDFVFEDTGSIPPVTTTIDALFFGAGL